MMQFLSSIAQNLSVNKKDISKLFKLKKDTSKVFKLVLFSFSA